MVTPFIDECKNLINSNVISTKELAKGAEAKAIYKMRFPNSIIIKYIDNGHAKDESFLISLANQYVEHLFPLLIYNGVNDDYYILEYIEGQNLQTKFVNEFCLLNKNPQQELIFKSIDRLRELHISSKSNYISNYHETIVDYRLDRIFDSPRINSRFRTLGNYSINGLYELENFIIRDSNGNSIHKLRDKLEEAISLYNQYLPRYESVIHGDPHLGNIIAARDGSIVFIDPRVKWDGVENNRRGYFDPLYDIACICHSVISVSIINYAKVWDFDINENDRVITFTEDASDCIKLHQSWVTEILLYYLQRPPKLGELIRYKIYLICCLVGNLQYLEWTPTIDTIIYNYYFCSHVLDELFADSEVVHNSVPG